MPEIRPFRLRLLTGAATAAAVLAIALVAAERWADARWLLRSPSAGADAATALALAYPVAIGLAVWLCAALALLVSFRGGPSKGNRTLGLFLGALALAFALESNGSGLWLLLAVTDVWRMSGLWYGFWTDLLWGLATAVGLAAGVRWSQLFPEPLQAETIRASPGPQRLRRLQARALDARLVWLGLGGASGIVAFTVMALPGDWWMLSILWSLAVVALITLNLTTSYRVADTTLRSRIYWVVAATVVGLAFVGASVPVELWVHVIGTRSAIVRWLHALLMPLGLIGWSALLSFAVLYRGAVDSALVVRKTTLYGALGVLLVGLFVGLEELLSGLLGDALGLPEALGGWAAGLAVAVAFQPLRARLGRWTGGFVDRLLPATALAAGPWREAVVAYVALAEPGDGATAILHTAAREAARRWGGTVAPGPSGGVLLELPSAEDAIASARDVMERFRSAADALGLDASDVRAGIEKGPVATGREGRVVGEPVDAAVRVAMGAAAGEVALGGGVAGEVERVAGPVS